MYIAISVTILVAIEVTAAYLIHRWYGWGEVRRMLRNDSPIVD
jgi:hypothetical protein